MDPKRLVIGSVVGTVVLNVYGVVVWDLLLGDFFATHAGSASGVEREAPVWWAVVLGALLMAALVTMVLEWSGSWSMGDAFKTGAILGLLLWGGVDFVYFGFFNLTDLVGTVTDVALGGLQLGVTGLAIAAAAGKGATAGAAGGSD